MEREKASKFVCWRCCPSVRVAVWTNDDTPKPLKCSHCSQFPASVESCRVMLFGRSTVVRISPMSTNNRRAQRTEQNSSDTEAMPNVPIFYSILQTPFTSSGEIDKTSLLRLLEHRIEAGADGLFLLGVASESMFLTWDEKLQIVELVTREIRGRLPVMVAAYEPATGPAVISALRWQDMGATSIIALPPYACTPTNDAIIQHFAQMAAAISIPLIVQDEPNTSGVTMGASIIARIGREVDNVGGFKLEGQPVTEKLTAVRNTLGENTQLFSAAGTFFVEELRRGSNGMMSGYVFPEIIRAVLDRFSRTDDQGAGALWDRYLPLTASESRPALLWSVRKQILKLRGLVETPTVRSPALTVDSTTRSELPEMLARLNLLKTYPYRQ